MKIEKKNLLTLKVHKRLDNGLKLTVDDDDKHGSTHYICRAKTELSEPMACLWNVQRSLDKT